MKDKIIKREYVFLWDWCDICGSHIVCPKCGNNTCNGMYGDSDGDPKKSGRGCGDGNCPICSLAYQYADLCFDNGITPKNKHEISLLNKQILRKYLGCS